jgi:hypothetical protein
MKILATSTLLVLLLMATAVMASDEESSFTLDEESSFTFSADPTERVLWMELVGDEAYMATIYGDGRLEYARESRDRSRLLGEASITLSFEDVRSLIKIALRSGLVEYDEELLQEEVRKLTVGNSLMSSHQGKTIVGFALESLDDREEVKIEISCENVDGLAAAYPMIPEYQGITALVQAMYAHWRTAFKGSEK